MTHSIPDACRRVLHTPVGTVLITGDYKFDQTPVDGMPADVGRLAELGREGLLLLCGDSTNADRPGFSPSEAIVGPQLQEIFLRCEGRIVVTCFASNIHRVQQVVDAAAAHGRKVSLVGRSMRKNVNIGRSLGHIEVPEGILVQPREIDDFPDEKLVIISTGSQGEPLSALRRMAHRDHPQVELHEGDTVVFSATPIPGNERAVNETIDRLYHIGCDVITTRDAPIHASGHGYAEELKLMLNLVQPHYVMPFHGDHKRIQLHGQLAEAVGIDADNIFKGENGLPLELDGKGARFGTPERAGMIFVDGVDIGDPPTSRCATAGCSAPTASSSSSRRSPSRTARRSPSPRSSSAASRSRRGRGAARRHPRHRRGARWRARRARRSARSTCCRRCSTTTSPSSSTTA